jgi:hypothetical protein
MSASRFDKERRARKSGPNRLRLRRQSEDRYGTLRPSERDRD